MSCAVLWRLLNSCNLHLPFLDRFVSLAVVSPRQSSTQLRPFRVNMQFWRRHVYYFQKRNKCFSCFRCDKIEKKKSRSFALITNNFVYFTNKCVCVRVRDCSQRVHECQMSNTNSTTPCDAMFSHLLRCSYTDIFTFWCCRWRWQTTNFASHTRKQTIYRNINSGFAVRACNWCICVFCIA